MINTKHYHVVSGLHGYMPDSNNTYRTKTDAREGLRELIKIIIDSCEPRRHDGKCCSGTMQSGYLEFTKGHGLEYAEITICDIPDCLLEIE